MTTSKSFELNPTTIFHVLRHFSHCSDELKESLVGETYTYFDYVDMKLKTSVIEPEDPDRALASVGGNFYTDIEIEEVLQTAQAEFYYRMEQKKLTWKNGPGEGEYSTQFEYQFDRLVGDCTLLPLDSIPQSLQPQISQVPRSQLPGDGTNKVNVLTTDELILQQTSSIRVEIVDTPSLPFLFFTCYPADPSNANLDLDDQVFILNT
jgi:hypothetical protein